jgi:hypothetical protein|tara:strand:+ start:562 stop:789 length:228 start_codon:yes stop_codon:yes gene_type:complete
MENTKEILINECIGVLKREDVKQNIKEMFYPIIDMIMIEIWPYIFISLLFVILSFLIILGNFILLIRSKSIGKIN